ncbi:HlyD family type I secretion periplasmic adaptor subunit [Chromobacterium amazonense]|uniref:HlyD family type I secretion periplasmic adaptor subunit n=1 Tax=Chromobacterium amazonense TaxID=1382803 RepID=UPI000B03CA62|nr:HlyD family type I secretion periplasmic adaptor subunit [Chromobacterium amazonense]
MKQVFLKKLLVVWTRACRCGQQFQELYRKVVKSWQDRISRKLAPHEREFLPAALEVLETPASPAGRWLAYVLMALFALALAWACLGEVGVTAVAQGQVMPDGGVKSIQPLEAGIVRKIHVMNGQHVEAGQILLELDSTENQVDVSQLQRQLGLALQDIERLRAVLVGIDHISRHTALPGGEHGNTPLQMRIKQQLGAYQARVAALMAQSAENKALLIASQLEQEKLTARLPALADKAEAWRQLNEQGMAPRLQWLEFENERIGIQKSLEVEMQRMLQHRANGQRIQAELIQYQADMRRQLLGELAEAEDKASEAELNIRRYSEREKTRYLRAPVSGHVQQLAVHTIGGVVQQAQQIMVIAPDHAKLVVDALVLNQDIGFVRSGQQVTLKVDSYPYSKYGTLSGIVEHLSHDAIPDEKRGPVYAARILLADETISKTGMMLALQAGMAVTAEIKTDSRKVIDYLLSPIREVMGEALMER